MGVMIFLNIMPNHIGESAWGKVYDETLELVNAYPFVDKIFDRHSYDCDWAYLSRTKERKISFADNHWGWHTIGDEQSLRLAESFMLIKDLHYYRNNASQDGNCDDILFSGINNYPVENEYLEQLKVDDVIVFDAKTQGEPYHIPLLAIACLIESRFPRHVIVSGDISIGQMEKAVEQANTILTHPIALSERTDNKKLLTRIKDNIQDESSALEAFMRFTMSNHDIELGDLVRKQFKSETIAKYYKSAFSDYKVGTFGFSDLLSRFIEQGFRLEDACELCVLDPDGCNYNAREFAEAVLSMEWPKKKIDTDDSIPLKVNAPDATDPDTVNSMFGKTLL